jgi:hypothetical protein
MTFQKIKGIAAWCDCPLMGHPVPPWDAEGRGSWPAIVYHLNMYVERSRARAVIQEAEHLELSERDSLRVLALLENPAKPNPKLLAAAKSLPKRK